MSTHANATAVKTTGTKSTRSARRSRPLRRGGVTMRIGDRSVIVPVGRRLTVCGEELLDDFFRRQALKDAGLARFQGGCAHV